MTFVELRDAKPQLWITAADDHRNAAKQCERVSEDILNNGVRELNENWPDHVGQLAVGVLKKIVTTAQTTSILARASIEPVDALARAVVIAQNELENGVHIAEANELTVDPVTGVVSLPSTRADRDPIELLLAMSRAQQMINDAVEAATQANSLCESALQAAFDGAANPNMTVADAQLVQSDNIHKALQEIRDTLPDGLSPTEVRQWWDGLTPKEQFDLQRAVPVELHDLPGIPDSVKAQLTNDGRGYNPVETVRWAESNALNEGLDRLPSNCTLFVSESLHAGGLAEKEGQWSKQDWLNPLPNLPGFNGKDLDKFRYNRPWIVADDQRNFFLNNGGSTVPLSEARPGDVIYFNWSDPSAHNGEVSHHSAIVTGVLPDGEVLYSQHTAGAVTYGYQGRLPVRLQQQGEQSGVIVRPQETW